MDTWNFRTTTADSGEVYKAEQLYFKRFSTYPQHPTPTPVKPPVTGEQLPLL